MANATQRLQRRLVDDLAAKAESWGAAGREERAVFVDKMLAQLEKADWGASATLPPPLPCAAVAAGSLRAGACLAVEVQCLQVVCGVPRAS